MKVLQRKLDILGSIQIVMDFRKAKVQIHVSRGKGPKSYIGPWCLSKNINRSEDKQIMMKTPRPSFIRREQTYGCPSSTYSSNLMNMVQNI